jgi:hypothetical protein
MSNNHGINSLTKCCKSVFHGKWIDRKLYFVCGKCGMTFQRHGRLFNFDEEKEKNDLFIDRS